MAGFQVTTSGRFWVTPKGEEAAAAHRSTIRAVIPPLGQVRLITVTDLQFGKMEVFYGKKPREPEEIPEQILLF